MRTWRNWRSCRLTLRGWVVLVAVIVLPLVYTATRAEAANTTPPPVSAAGMVGSGLPTQVNVYATPCDERVRVAHGVPQYRVDGTGMIQWEIDNAGTEEASAYHAALDTCDRDEPVARWAWADMILVSIDYLP